VFYLRNNAYFCTIKRNMEDNKIIEEAVRLVDEGIIVTLPVDGRSMLPFIIGGKESVVLGPVTSLSVGDVALAWVDGCRYVVHRILSIDDDQIVLMGDGNIRGVEHCQLRDVKARVSHVVDEKGRRHDLYCPWRMCASRLWTALRPIRRYLLFIYKRVHR